MFLFGVWGFLFCFSDVSLLRSPVLLNKPQDSLGVMLWVREQQQ